MFSFLSSYNEARWKAKHLKAQGQLLRKAAKSTKAQAENRAVSLTDVAAKNQRLEAENLMRYRENQRAKVGEVKAARAGSGFTDEGTGDQAEVNTREMLDRYIADRAFSASVAMSNAWQAATDARHQGTVTAMGQNAEADQYQMQAKGIRSAANWSLAAGILGSALGAYQGYMKAGEYNASLEKTARTNDLILTNAYDRGEISFEQMQDGIRQNAAMQEQMMQNPWEHAFMGSSQAGNYAYHGTAAFSPFIASFSSEVNNRKNNWGGLLSVLTGNVPYKVPAAGTIFSPLF
jgi:hypothetical protein